MSYGLQAYECIIRICLSLNPAGLKLSMESGEQFLLESYGLTSFELLLGFVLCKLS